MRNLMFSLVFVLLNAPLIAQTTANSEKDKVQGVIQQLFDALEQRDSTMLKQVVKSEGQVWTYTNSKVGMRPFQKDLDQVPKYPPVKEVPLDFDIKIQEGLAVAWVPYTFWVNDELSHCGVDVFTLIKIENRWKIVSAAYTVEKENCKKQR